MFEHICSANNITKAVVHDFGPRRVEVCVVSNLGWHPRFFPLIPPTQSNTLTLA